jgi:MFS family permease
MQRVAQDWLVLTVLTADSGLAVGVTTGLQFAPMLLLAPVAGVVADRFDRRRVLIATQAGSGLLALILGLLVLSGAAQLWHVFVLAGLLGVVSAVDAPARQAFVSQMVPEADLPNAVGLNSASFHAGRLIGPGVAGLLIHWFGTGPVFLINAVSFGAVLVSLTRMRSAELIPSPVSVAGRRGVRAGLGYVRRRPVLIVTMTLVGVVGTFGLNFQLTTALMARLVFDKGAGEYGLLGSVMAVGSLAGALLAARREHPGLRLVVFSTLAFAISCVAAALMPTYVTFAVALIPVGLSALTLMTAANTSVQLATEPEMRGRVMALYIAIFMGGTPVGAPIIGWVGETFGARWTILGGGLVCLVAGLVALAWLTLQTPAASADQPVDLGRGGDRGHRTGSGGGEGPGRAGATQRHRGIEPVGQARGERPAEGIARRGGVDRGDREGVEDVLGAVLPDGDRAPGAQSDHHPAGAPRLEAAGDHDGALGVAHPDRLAEHQ